MADLTRKRDYFSFSQIKSYLNCPLQYKYKYIDGIETTPSKIMLNGKNTHENLAEILERKELEGIPEKAQSLIEKYFYSADEYFVEKEINYELFIYQIKIIIDLYAVKGNTIYLLDWKRNLLPEDDLQLKLYCLILKELNPQIDNFIAWYYTTESNFFKRYFYTKEDLIEFENYLYSLIEKIENEEKFEANIGSHCSWCPYVNLCLQDKELPVETVNNLIIKDDKHFKEIANKVILYETVLNKIKEVMKNYLIQNGVDEIQINENDKFYLSYMISMRTGKVKNNKKKTNDKK